VTDAEAQLAAVRLGFRMSGWPCVVGDADSLLVHIPDTPLLTYGTLWLLVQGDNRKKKRVRLLTEFISRRFAPHSTLVSRRSLSEPVPGGRTVGLFDAVGRLA
jgi:DNA-binding transcriptional LysR family regulator